MEISTSTETIDSTVWLTLWILFGLKMMIIYFKQNLVTNFLLLHSTKITKKWFEKPEFFIRPLPVHLDIDLDSCTSVTQIFRQLCIDFQSAVRIYK